MAHLCWQLCLLPVYRVSAGWCQFPCFGDKEAKPGAQRGKAGSQRPHNFTSRKGKTEFDILKFCSKNKFRIHTAWSKRGPKNMYFQGKEEQGMRLIHKNAEKSYSLAKGDQQLGCKLSWGHWKEEGGISFWIHHVIKKTKILLKKIKSNYFSNIKTIVCALKGPLAPQNFTHNPLPTSDRGQNN